VPTLVPIVATYHPNKRGLNEYALYSRPLQRCIVNRARVVKAVARALAPMGPTGGLRSSIRTMRGTYKPHRLPRRFAVYVFSDLPYAAAIEQGRDAYAQYPGRKFMARTVERLNAPKRERTL
jgi:hypothetical protein